MKTAGIIVGMIVLLFGILVPRTFGQERIKLVKVAGNPAVYFVDEQRVRHAFPNALTYESWYGKSFTDVVTVSKEYLSSLTLGVNVTMKPGTYLLNVPYSSMVYAPEPGGVLRPIQDGHVANEVFGDEWYRLIRPLPEIFFQNYIIGEPIRSFRDVPDGWAVKSSASVGAGRDLPLQMEKYYLKWKGTLQPFASAKVADANGYDVNRTLVDGQYFSHRPRTISGRAERFADPMFVSNESTLSCGLSDLRLGIVIVANRALTKDEMGVLRDTIYRLPGYYSQATEKLGTVSPENNVVVMDFDKTFDDAEHASLSFEEVARTYYDVHNDDIDFLAVFHTVYNDRKNHDEIARYVPVSNVISGTGKSVYNRSNEFGSLGRLKGVLDMGHISQYAGDVGKGPNLTLGTLVHEIMHSVSGSMMVLDGTNTTRDILLGYQDPFHWSRFLLETSFLGGDGWSPEDGNADIRGLNADERRLFISDISWKPDFRRRFSDLDLYAFGFIPARSVPPIKYLDVADRSNPTHRVEGVVKSVNMDQVVKLNGRRECVVKSNGS